MNRDNYTLCGNEAVSNQLFQIMQTKCLLYRSFVGKLNYSPLGSTKILHAFYLIIKSVYFSKDENLSGIILKIGQSHRCRFRVSRNTAKSLQTFNTGFDIIIFSEIHRSILANPEKKIELV